MFAPNKHYFLIRNLILALCALPICRLLVGFIDDGLAPNIFAALSHSFGHTAFILLIVALGITPLRRWSTWFFVVMKIKWGRRLADWNFLIRVRRPIGVTAFFYMLMHIITYLYLELDFILEELIYEIKTRYFLAPGLIAALIMTLLAVTSLDYFRRRMGRWWRHLHRLMYPLCILVVIHYWLFAKVTDPLPKLYLVLVSVFLIHRLVVVIIKPLTRKDDTGMEASRK